MKTSFFISLIILLTTAFFFSVIPDPVQAQDVPYGPEQTEPVKQLVTYDNGDRYEGYFVNDLYNGEGTYTWANGDRYEGEFMNGQITGRGRLTFFGSGQSWEGLFINGVINNGSGVFHWGDEGDKFEGQWVDGLPDGAGILIYSDGTRKEAVFSNGYPVSPEETDTDENRRADGIQTQPSADPDTDPFQNLKIGDVVSFGQYEQDNVFENGSEAIQWQCLHIDANTGQALLISRYGLEIMPYHLSDMPITWETSDIRNYLKHSFFKAAFNDNDRQRITQTLISNPGNPDYGIDGGNNTDDYVFLLSIEEVLQFFPSKDLRKAQPTEYALSKGAEGTAAPGYAWWWLRTPGQNSNTASNINSDGSLLRIGSKISVPNGMVRPAIWVKLAE